MDKITFDELIVEITRRCDMSCKHCFRGDAQCVDIAPQHIDHLLDQTEVIGRLVITGGEPLLNVEALSNLYDAIRTRGVMLLGFELISNGHTFDKGFADIIKRFGDLVYACNRLCRPNLSRLPRKDFVSLCVLGISLDRYHADHDICMENYRRYKSALRGHADVIQILHGNTVSGLGRSKNLIEDQIDLSEMLDAYKDQRIELFSADCKTLSCRNKTFSLCHPEQKIVPCVLYLDVYGRLKHSIVSTYEYELADSFPAICKASDPIWKSLIKYNRGKLPCSSFQKSLLEKVSNNNALKTFLLRINDTKETDPQSQDEPLSALKEMMWSA